MVEVTGAEPVVSTGVNPVMGSTALQLLTSVLGHDLIASMRHTFEADPRIQNPHTIDIVVRKDGVEKRIEADWLKTLARLFV